MNRKAYIGSLAIPVIFVLVIQLISLYITEVNKAYYYSIGFSYIPSSSPQGSVINVLAIIASVFAATLLLNFLLKSNKINLFKLLVFSSLALTSYLLTLLNVDAILSLLPLNSNFTECVVYFMPLIPIVIIGYSLFANSIRFVTSAVLGFISAEAGSFFALTLPKPTVFMLAIAFALYDVYAVFKGPLKQLASTTSGLGLEGLVVKVGNFTIGLGDNVFYSMLPSVALYYYKIYDALFTSFAIDLGVIVTLILLKKRKMLPGLPLPVFLGLLFFYISTFL